MKDWQPFWIDIKKILNEEWDPIGVSGVFDDEYDMYVLNVHSLLNKNAAKDEIVDMLLDLEGNRMGMTLTENSKTRAQIVAQSLLDLRRKYSAPTDGK